MQKSYLRITEIDHAEQTIYSLGSKVFDTETLRNAEFDSTHGECSGAPQSSEGRTGYEWRLESLEPSGMVIADKPISQETVEQILGCSVETARESAQG